MLGRLQALIPTCSISAADGQKCGLGGLLPVAKLHRVALVDVWESGVLVKHKGVRNKLLGRGTV